MTVHFYAFGSICRGEVDESSDVDLLACITDSDKKVDTNKFSVYTHERVKDLWQEGNPFAWHLYLESKLLYSEDKKDFLQDLGPPRKYKNGLNDCTKFRNLFEDSLSNIKDRSNSQTFDISCMFLATRNFATCYSLHVGKPNFSRNSPLVIEEKLKIKEEVFKKLMRARILSTRGIGEELDRDEVNEVIDCAPVIKKWMRNLTERIENV